MDTYANQVLDLIYKFVEDGWKIKIESYPLYENGVRITVSNECNALPELHSVSTYSLFKFDSAMGDFYMLQCLLELAEKIGLEV